MITTAITTKIIIIITIITMIIIIINASGEWQCVGRTVGRRKMEAKKMEAGVSIRVVEKGQKRGREWTGEERKVTVGVRREKKITRKNREEKKSGTGPRLAVWSKMEKMGRRRREMEKKKIGCPL